VTPLILAAKTRKDAETTRSLTPTPAQRSSKVASSEALGKARMTYRTASCTSPSRNEGGFFALCFRVHRSRFRRIPLKLIFGKSEGCDSRILSSAACQASSEKQLCASTDPLSDRSDITSSDIVFVALVLGAPTA